MVERALLIALVALAIVGAATAISDGFTKVSERLVCALDKAEVCILDGNVQ